MSQRLRPRNLALACVLLSAPLGGAVLAGPLAVQTIQRVQAVQKQPTLTPIIPSTLPSTLPSTSPPASVGGLPELQPIVLPASPSTPLVPLGPINPTLPNTATDSSLPTDPLFEQQWNLFAIRAPQAWALLQKSAAKANFVKPSPVTVAVLDTGWTNSPELKGRLVNGYDFVSNITRAGDGNGRDADATAVGQYASHATEIAHIIAAAHDGQGLVGINPLANIVHIRVAGVDGTIEVNDLAAALRWAAGIPVAGVPNNPNPAKLINLSLYVDFISLTGCDARIQSAINAVFLKGVLVIAGAANDGADAKGYTPAGCQNVLTVTSVSETGQRPSYANWGQSVGLAATGGEVGHGLVVSADVNDPRRPNGTSYAAPHATGVASLLLGVQPKLSPSLLKSYLIQSSTPFMQGGCDPAPLKTCGRGMLNAEAALKLVLGSLLNK